MYQRLRGTCFSRRFGRWEPGPVGGMGVGFGEGALTKLLGGAGVSILLRALPLRRGGCFCSKCSLCLLRSPRLSLTTGSSRGDLVGPWGGAVLGDNKQELLLDAKQRLCRLTKAGSFLVSYRTLAILNANGAKK